MKWLLRLLFILIFGFVSYYIVEIESKQFESTSITLLKDLSKKQDVDLGALSLIQSSSTLQDSKVLELYIRSYEMYNYLDNQYKLSSYYTSDNLDIIQRLYYNAPISLFEASKKNLLEAYNKNLLISFDEPSGTLSLTFIHTNPNTAQSILKSIILHSEIIINEFAKENAHVALKFINKQRDNDKKAFNASIKKLVAYQNKHHTIDPNMDVKRKNTILANLEAEYMKLNVEYNSKSKSYNLNGSEMKILKERLRNIKASIRKTKAQMVGNGDLNANVFKFELLRNNMEFSKEIYKQILINQEKLKLEVTQNDKHIIVVSKPTLADNHTYPNIIWDIFTLFIILLILYSIIITIIEIIRDHKD